MKFDFLDKLTPAQKKWLQWLGGVLVIGVLGFFGIAYPQIPVPPLPEIGAQAVAGAVRCGANGSYGQCFRAENGGDIGVFSDGGATSKFSVDGATGNTTVAGTFAQTGAATFASTLALQGVPTFSTNVILSSESITPTDTTTFTPTKTIVTLTPAGALGTTIGACTTGQITILYNSVNAAVVISDTGNFIGAGDATLGQYDTLPLICISGKWVQISAVSAN